MLISNHVTSQSWWQNLRTGINGIQEQIVASSSELASGKRSSVVAVFGSKSQEVIEAYNSRTIIRAYEQINRQTEQKLQTVDNVLEVLAGRLDEANESLLLAKNGSLPRESLANIVQEKMSGLEKSLAVTVAGEYVFSGEATGSVPLKSLSENTPGTPRFAVQSAFEAHFGFATTDNQTGNITPAAMKSFLNTQFQALFDDAGWDTNWANATADTRIIPLGESDTIELPNANTMQAVRKLAQGYSLISEFSVSGLKQETYDAVVDQALNVLGAANSELTWTRASNGLQQEKLARSNDALARATASMDKTIGSYEDVDQIEAATTLNFLTSQLEVAYGITGKIQNLFLARYL